jgi:hypothetical protein
MSVALILAAIIEAGTLLLCLLLVLADSMSDAPSAPGISVAPVFWTGSIVAGLIAATHFLPPGVTW